MKNIYLFSHDVLIKDDMPTDGAIELIRHLSKNQYPFLILSDRSLHSRNRMADRMYECGFPLFSEDLFYTSTMAAVDAIRSNYPERNRAAVIGSESMKRLIQKGGFLMDSERPHWLFVGTQRDATYRDYNAALQAVMNGAVIISVSDSNVIWQRNQAQLGSGAIATMLEYASGTEALVSGWSSPVMVKKSLSYIGIEPEEALFVSDNLQTEIATAHTAGVSTVYVLGENRYEDLGASDIHPTYVVDSLKGLFV